MRMVQRRAVKAVAIVDMSSQAASANVSSDVAIPANHAACAPADSCRYFNISYASQILTNVIALM